MHADERHRTSACIRVHRRLQTTASSTSGLWLRKSSNEHQAAAFFYHRDPKARRIAKKAKEGTFFCDSSRLRVLAVNRLRLCHVANYLGSVLVAAVGATLVNVPLDSRWNGPPSRDISCFTVKVVSDTIEIARRTRKV